MKDAQDKDDARVDEPPPQATVQALPGIAARMRQLGTRVWLLTALCLLVAIFMVITSLGTRGTEISVTFKQGHGIKPGDTLRHRGIEVGEVKSVEIAKDLEGVVVAIRLQDKASDLAREGSQFWIERPRVSLSRVAGLDTVVGAKYIAVQPGPADGQRQTTFLGVESPRSLMERSSTPAPATSSEPLCTR